MAATTHHDNQPSLVLPQPSWPEFTDEDVDAVKEVVDFDREVIEAAFRVALASKKRSRREEIIEVLLGGVNVKSLLERSKSAVQNYQKLVTSSLPSTSVRKECVICYEELDISGKNKLSLSLMCCANKIFFFFFFFLEMFTLDCPSSHRFCYECIRAHVEVAVKEKKQAKCPVLKCDHLITPKEVKEMQFQNNTLQLFG